MKFGPPAWVLPLVLAAAAAMPAPSWAIEDAAPADPGEAAPSRDAAWEWGPSALLYVVPGQAVYLQPTLTVDHGALHLEARYNYEALRAGSAWVGWNFSIGEELRLDLTPMAGGVVGTAMGVALGVTFTLEWGPLALWHQSEYVFDLADATKSFYYVWSELGVTFPDWLRVGLALQRTRAFETSTEVQWGPFVGVSFWKLSATVYYFSPGQDDQFAVVGASGTF